MQPTKNEELLGELKAIERENGFISPHAVVEKAQSEASPLHKYFEWDDHQAAQQHRLWQARQLIANVKVEWLGRETQAFWSATIEVSNQPVKGYFSTERVVSNEELHKQVLSDALKELRYWQEKYRHIEELAGAVNEQVVHNAEVVTA